MAARIANFQYPELPWATLLLQQKVAFVQFVAGLPSSTVGTGQQHTLHQVLTMDPRKVCAMDTSCGTGPWRPYAQPPEHSRHGRDLHEISVFFYNDATKQWEWYIIHPLSDSLLLLNQDRLYAQQHSRDQCPADD